MNIVFFKDADEESNNDDDRADHHIVIFHQQYFCSESFIFLQPHIDMYVFQGQHGNEGKPAPTLTRPRSFFPQPIGPAR